MPTNIKPKWDCINDLQVADELQFHLSENQKTELSRLVTDLGLIYKYPNKAEEEITFIKAIDGLVGIYAWTIACAKIAPTKKQQEAAKDELLYLLDESVKRLNGEIGGLHYNLEKELGTFNNEYLGNSKVNEFIHTVETFTDNLRKVKLKSNPRAMRKNAKLRMAVICIMEFNMYFTESAKATCNTETGKFGAYARLLEWCFIIVDKRSPSPESLKTLVKDAIYQTKKINNEQYGEI